MLYHYNLNVNIMPLTKCPDCGKDVSDKALECVHCGCPLQPKDNPDLIECSHCKHYVSKDTYNCLICGHQIKEYKFRKFDEFKI